MITPIDEDYIDDLKEISPKVERHIKRIASETAAVFYHKRLQQLADAAREKVLSLKTGERIVANL